jgi:hypothetical protein
MIEKLSTTRNDIEPGSETPAPGGPDDGNSSQPLPEPLEEYSSAVSGSLPPVILAFPDHGYEQKPPPGHDIDSPSIPWPTIVAVVAVSIAVIVVAVAITVALTRRGGPNPSPTAVPSTSSTVPVTTPPPSTVTVTTALPTVTVTTPPPAAPLPQNASLQKLRAQADIDYPVATAWAENLWVPQLSSKQPGTVDDGIRWDHHSIWQEHLRLRQQYGAKLLWSGDWPNTFKKPDYWVSIAGFAFPDAAGAWAWCQNQRLDRDHCLAMQVQ